MDEHPSDNQSGGTAEVSTGRALERTMWSGGPVIVFDTETTGSATGDRVVSLGAVRLDAALEPEATLHLAFAPGIPCHWGAIRVHGMSDAFLSLHPPFEEHAAEIAAFFGGHAAAAHNLAFD